jgi:hypothetical protein
MSGDVPLTKNRKLEGTRSASAVSLPSFEQKPSVPPSATGSQPQLSPPPAPTPAPPNLTLKLKVNSLPKVCSFCSLWACAKDSVLCCLSLGRNPSHHLYDAHHPHPASRMTLLLPRDPWYHLVHCLPRLRRLQNIKTKSMKTFQS